ncbi:penicillin-binding protein activator LpoB [Treponema primitia]|uniref:penicillin-binding protein activator LpoB n=1 Tax=Treponema primitia TaxID=88058 RepID=UPI0002554C70|nr:penicillin-binding protein activator LpoB [Treponema primitia]
MKTVLKTLFASALVLALFASCSSNPKVTRVDASTQTDLSGLWNDTDVRIVCDSLIKTCLDSPRVTAEIARRGRLPTILVGSFKNDSDEHIDTSIISSTMEVAIFNSGKADFVAGGNTRNEVRAERQDQQGNASENTAAALSNETGADFLLTGAVKTIIDRAGGTSTRTYFVTAELTNIETNARMWMDQNSEIKKVIQTPKSKL